MKNKFSLISCLYYKRESFEMYIQNEKIKFKIIIKIIIYFILIVIFRCYITLLL